MLTTGSNVRWVLILALCGIHNNGRNYLKCGLASAGTLRGLNAENNVLDIQFQSGKDQETTISLNQNEKGYEGYEEGYEEFIEGNTEAQLEVDETEFVDGSFEIVYEEDESNPVEIPKCGVNASWDETEEKCVCLSGFEGNDPTVICLDIDECAMSFSDPCMEKDPHARCFNTEGTYKCICKEGYKGNPNKNRPCHDPSHPEEKIIHHDSFGGAIDMQVHENAGPNNLPIIEIPESRMNPCESAKNLCDGYANSECVPDTSEQGFTCQCNEFYKGNPLKGQECTMGCNNPYYSNPCGPENICHETDYGYTCEILDNIDGCPGGSCSPGMYCATKQIDDGREIHECVCNPGYYQPNPYFPCRPIESPEAPIEDTP